MPFYTTDGDEFYPTDASLYPSQVMNNTVLPSFGGIKVESGYAYFWNQYSINGVNGAFKVAIHNASVKTITFTDTTNFDKFDVDDSSFRQ